MIDTFCSHHSQQTTNQKKKKELFSRKKDSIPIFFIDKNFQIKSILMKFQPKNNNGHYCWNKCANNKKKNLHK